MNGVRSVPGVSNPGSLGAAPTGWEVWSFVPETTGLPSQLSFRPLFPGKQLFRWGDRPRAAQACAREHL